MLLPFRPAPGPPRSWSLCATCRLEASLALSRVARSRRYASNEMQRMGVLGKYSRSIHSAANPHNSRDGGLRRFMWRQQHHGSVNPSQYQRRRIESARQQRNGTRIGAFNGTRGYATGPRSSYADYSDRRYGSKAGDEIYGSEKISEAIYESASSPDRIGDIQFTPDEDRLRQNDEGGWEEVDVRQDGGGHDDALEYMTSAQLNDDARLLDDLRAAQMGYTLELQDETGEMDDEADPTHRTHPITAANRFGTNPGSIAFPQHTFLDPIAAQISGTSPANLSQAAHRVFGGIGLPYSTSTPTLAKTMQQKPVALDVTQGRMSEIEADVFLATLVPGIYASVMSALVETRKRLGTAWAEELVHKAGRGELRILDAGGAGAGLLAVRDMLRAEWERMHEDNTIGDSIMALAEADGRLGGPPSSPPVGAGTVLVASDALRHRASKLLENTTFVPRLPDYIHTEDAKRKGKFDLVLASHSLWPLREDYMRKAHVENLWSLLSAEGGVLVLLEKGVARGFEAIAAARQMLLNSHIASPPSTKMSETDTAGEEESGRSIADNSSHGADEVGPDGGAKEAGSIIAPCTNHSSCPMYKPQGLVKGRRDICHFSQRYFRIPAQQRILKARDKNFEDVRFSFVSVQRGRDVRVGIQQGQTATDAAFEGYGKSAESGSSSSSSSSSSSLSSPASLTLPRAVLPPLKRRGHVILDLCTPAGTLERWTVPRSSGRQTYRDARKSSWGDLWPLGAKTRVPRVPHVKKRRDRSADHEQSDAIERSEGEEPQHSRRRAGVPDESGRMRTQKIKGLRDKRDKKADGRGRIKAKKGEYE